MRNLLAALAAAALLASGCSSDEPEFSAEPRPELAVQPDDSPIMVADDDSDPASPDSTEPGSIEPGPGPASPDDTTGAPAGTPSDPTAPPTDGAPAPVARAVLRRDDRTGDHGLLGPDRADLTRLIIEDFADSARVTVQVAADLPARPADGEVFGVGVDFYPGGNASSGYQLFAVGNADGWFAYLQQPEGFIEYPGFFRLGGRSLQFEVPWDALGGEVDGTASVFLDWAQPSDLGVTANSSRDTAPDQGAAQYAP